MPLKSPASSVEIGSWQGQETLGMPRWGSKSDHNAKLGPRFMVRTAQGGFPNCPDNRETKTQISSGAGHQSPYGFPRRGSASDHHIQPRHNQVCSALEGLPT